MYCKENINDLHLARKEMRAIWLYIRRQASLEPERRKLWFPVVFAMGIGVYFGLPIEPSKWITLFILELLLVLAFVFRFRPHILKFIMWCGIFFIGFAWTQVHSLHMAIQTKSTMPLGSKQYISAQIKNIDFNHKNNLRLTLNNIKNFDDKPIEGIFRVSLPNKDQQFYTGQCVELIATFFPLSPTPIVGGYQFDRSNFFKGLSGTGFANSRVLPVECSQKPSLAQQYKNHIHQIRHRIIQKIDQELPFTEASVASALIAGEQGRIPSLQMQQYRDSGLSHFLSISGLHMSLITALMFFSIRFFLAFFPKISLRINAKKISALFAIFVSFSYLLISGVAIPAQRAFIMTFIVLLGVLFNRQAISMYTIAWAAVLILIISPDALVSASFQMSFSAVIALIAFYERFAKSINSWFFQSQTSKLITVIKAIFAYLIGIIIADFVASIATLPFVIYHFNRVALYTTLANFLSGPIIGFVIMPFVLFSLVLMPLGLASVPLQICGLGIHLVNTVTAWVSSIEGATISILSMPFWGLLCIIFGALWLCIWQRQWRLWGLLGIAIGVLSFSCAKNPDILISADSKLIALKDEHNNMVILPCRGQQFIKQIWLEKTASPSLTTAQKDLLQQILKGETTEPRWLDLKCQNEVCIYKDKIKITSQNQIFLQNKLLNADNNQASSIYIHNEPVLVTVGENTGKRLWNVSK